MRILTRTQYDAICDIVMEQKKRIEKLEAEIKKRKEQVKNLEESINEKDKSIDYLNNLVFKRDRQIRDIIHNTHLDSYLIDFPATQKPENILI